MAPTWVGMDCYPVLPCHKAVEAYSGVDVVTLCGCRFFWAGP